MLSVPFVLLSASLLVFVFEVTCENATRITHEEILDRSCLKIHYTTCLKLRFAHWMENVDETYTVNLLPGLSVIRENGSDMSDTVAELARNFPNDIDARLDAFLIKKVTKYLNSYSIRLNAWHVDQGIETARQGGGTGGGGGAGGGVGGNTGMLLAAGGLMKGTLLISALGGLLAIAGKALMTGLISLVLSAIIGLKSLTNHHKKTTYEIVSKPIYSHSNTHSLPSKEYGHGGYGHSSYARSSGLPVLPHYRP